MENPPFIDDFPMKSSYLIIFIEFIPLPCLIARGLFFFRFLPGEIVSPALEDLKLSFFGERFCTF